MPPNQILCLIKDDWTNLEKNGLFSSKKKKKKKKVDLKLCSKSNKYISKRDVIVESIRSSELLENVEMFTGHNLQFCSKLQRGFRKRPVDSFRPRKFSSSLNKVNTKHFGSINKLSCKDAKPGLSQLNAAVGVGNSHLDLTRLILCAISSDKSTLTPPKVKLEPYF